MIRWWSPRLWGAHLIGLVCVAVAIGMGAWQYDAWQARRAAERVDLTQATPVALGSVFGPDDPFPAKAVGQPVTFSGTWLPSGTVLVAGRTGADGVDGRWVVTPVTVGDAGAPAIPVVRGWVPDTVAIDALPPVSGQVSVDGWLQPVEGTGEADTDPTDDVLPQLRSADLVQRVPVDLYGGYVVSRQPAPADAAGGVDAATLSQLPPAGQFTALRNILYAVEWWFFAAFAAFMWWRHVRDTTRPGTAEVAGGAGDPEGAVLS